MIRPDFFFCESKLNFFTKEENNISSSKGFIFHKLLIFSMKYINQSG